MNITPQIRDQSIVEAAIAYLSPPPLSADDSVWNVIKSAPSLLLKERCQGEMLSQTAERIIREHIKGLKHEKDAP